MQSLRKRGSDAGSRASWAFNLGELSDGGSGGAEQPTNYQLCFVIGAFICKDADKAS
jgi:hypothetical protein